MKSFVKYAKIMLVAILCLSLSLLFVACGDEEFKLTYIAGAGGAISGETSQTVFKGENGSTVTAIANSGYVFLEWSDGVTTASRTDKRVQNNISVTAEFKAQSTNNGGTGSNSDTTGLELDLATARMLYEFSTTNNQVTITKYIGSDTRVKIPSKIDGKSVVAIDEHAFNNCRSLASIIIPNSVINIGFAAFHGCDSLTSIIIPNSVTNIGSYAFSGCSSLTSIIIPNSVISIGKYLFYECSNLASIIIPNGVTSIGDSAFCECRGLTSVAIPNSVISIGNYAFSGCSSLTSVTFSGSSQLASIGDYAFSHCHNLSSIVMQSSVTSLGDRSFFNCDSLQSIIIPSGVTRIGTLAFKDCDNLIIYSEVERQPSAWASSWNYSNCPVYWGVTSRNLITDSQGVCYLVANGNAIVTNYVGSLMSVEIPSIIQGCAVTSIGSNGFYNCDSLTSIIIPNSVTNIGSYAFSGCSSLKSATFAGSSQLASIGEYAFYDCSNITSIVIPNSVISVGSGAFKKCGSLRIYCEAESQPDNWNSSWYDYFYPVYWYSEKTPTTSGKYWHYVDGVPTKW